ncbi:MAG TPA: hypothetical protein VL635_19455 [Trinickia sp.]|jgi:hypothetical protein|nr:hypothetical protein [Trinickia sp.]
MNATSIDTTELDAHVCAYNMAFAELGLRFRWDARTLASLAGIEDEGARIVAYVQAHHPHLLHAYSPEFLSQAILERKNALRPEPLPVCDAAAIETNRPSMLQVRAREAHSPVDFTLPMLAGA